MLFLYPLLKTSFPLWTWHSWKEKSNVSFTLSPMENALHSFQYLFSVSFFITTKSIWSCIQTLSLPLLTNETSGSCASSFFSFRFWESNATQALIISTPALDFLKVLFIFFLVSYALRRSLAAQSLCDLMNDMHWSLLASLTFRTCERSTCSKSTPALELNRHSFVRLCDPYHFFHLSIYLSIYLINQ